MIKNGNIFYDIKVDGWKRSMEKSCLINEEPTPQYPDMVDVLLTNKCNMGCRFCYLSCKPTGKGADWEFTYNYLKDNLPRYTELALGGGDLNEWKYTEKFIKLLREDAGFESVNGTYHWNSMPETLNKGYYHYFTAMGISVVNGAQINRADACLMAVGYKGYVNWHIIVDMLRVDTIRRMLETIERLPESRRNVLLLGLKRSGKGAQIRRLHNECKVKEIFDLSKRYGINVHGDTKFIKDYLSYKCDPKDEEYVKRGLRRIGFTFEEPREGQYSMFINAVDRYMTASSSDLAPIVRYPMTETTELWRVFSDIRMKNGFRGFESIDPNRFKRR